MGIRWVGVGSVLLLLGTSGCVDEFFNPLDPDPGTTTNELPDPSTGTADESSSGEPASSSGIADSTGDESTDDATGETTGGETMDPGCPECIVLADGLMSGRGIAVDDAYVYWSDEEAGTLHRIDKGGGNGMMLASGEGSPYEIAVAEGFLYWASNRDAGSVRRIPIDGGDLEILAAANNPRTIAVHGGFVYWGTAEDEAGALWRMPIDGGTAEEVEFFLGPFADIVVDDSGVYATVHTESAGGVGFIEPPNEGPPIGSLVFIDPELPGGAGGSMQLVGDLAQPFGLARTGDTLLWATGDGKSVNDPHSIFAFNIGDDFPTEAISQQMGPWGVTADDQYVYWTDFTDVKAMPLAGGEAVVLAELQNNARYITTDDAFVYWTTRDRVLQRPKL